MRIAYVVTWYDITRLQIECPAEGECEWCFCFGGIPYFPTTQSGIPVSRASQMSKEVRALSFLKPLVCEEVKYKSRYTVYVIVFSESMLVTHACTPK